MGLTYINLLNSDILKKRMLDSVHRAEHQGRDRILEVLKTRCF